MGYYYPSPIESRDAEDFRAKDSIKLISEYI